MTEMIKKLLNPRHYAKEREPRNEGGIRDALREGIKTGIAKAPLAKFIKQTKHWVGID